MIKDEHEELIQKLKQRRKKKEAEMSRVLTNQEENRRSNSSNGAELEPLPPFEVCREGSPEHVVVQVDLSIAFGTIDTQH